MSASATVTEAKYRAPDRIAFEVLYQGHCGMLLRVAQRLCRDPDLAQDLTQETWLRVWRARDRLQSVKTVKAWLIQILRREHARLFGKKIDRNTDIDQERLESFPGNDKVEQRVLLIQVLRALNDVRHPLILELVIGLSKPAIALRLGMTENALRIRICRDRQRLRRRFA